MELKQRLIFYILVSSKYHESIINSSSLVQTVCHIEQNFNWQNLMMYVLRQFKVYPILLNGIINAYYSNNSISACQQISFIFIVSFVFFGMQSMHRYRYLHQMHWAIDIDGLNRNQFLKFLKLKNSLDFVSIFWAQVIYTLAKSTKYMKCTSHKRNEEKECDKEIIWNILRKTAHKCIFHRNCKIKTTREYAGFLLNFNFNCNRNRNRNRNININTQRSDILFVNLSIGHTYMQYKLYILQ